MDSPMNKTTRQVYVEISQVATHLRNTTLSATAVKDVHICGLCKSSFSDISVFVQHKKSGCSGSDKLSSLPGPVLCSQPSLGFPTSGVSSREDNITSIESQHLRVTFDGSIWNVGQSQSQDPLTDTLQHKNAEDSVLQTRFLNLPYQEISASDDQGLQNTNEVRSSLVSRREFHIDEEDVATLLANQLASEVVTSVGNASATSSHGHFLDLPNNIVSEPRNTLDANTVHFPSVYRSQAPGEASDVLETSCSQGSEASNQDPGGKASGLDFGAGAEAGVEAGAESGADTGIGAANRDSLGSEFLVTNAEPISKSGDSVIVDGLKGRKFHKCPDCMFTTQYLKDMVRHTRKHSGERPFECEECHRSFSRADKLLVHRRIHLGVKTHKCHRCDYATTDSGSLRKHMRIHNDERPFKCQMCPYRSRDSSQLTVHLRTHTGDNPFACSYVNCSSSFKTSSDLKRHTRLHTGEKPFACTECDYRCAIKSNLRVHIRLNHSNRKTIPCKLCDYVASTRKAAKEHEQAHTGNAKTQPRKKNDTPHKRGGRGRGKEVDVKGGRPHGRNSTHSKPFCVMSYKCTYCEAAFVREDSWRSHMRQHKARAKQLVLDLEGTAASVVVQSKEACDTRPSKRTLEEVLGKNLPSQHCKLRSKPKCDEKSVIENPVMEKINKAAAAAAATDQAEAVETQPILLYVQNMPIVESAQLVSTPLLMAGCCGQYVSLPLVPAPFDGPAAYLQPAEPADVSTGATISLLPLQVDKTSTAAPEPLAE